MALFGMTARDWRDKHPGRKDNLRDDADVSQFVCLSNLEPVGRAEQRETRRVKFARALRIICLDMLGFTSFYPSYDCCCSIVNKVREGIHVSYLGIHVSYLGFCIKVRDYFMHYECIYRASMISVRLSMV